MPLRQPVTTRRAATNSEPGAGRADTGLYSYDVCGVRIVSDVRLATLVDAPAGGVAGQAEAGLPITFRVSRAQRPRIEPTWLCDRIAPGSTRAWLSVAAHAQGYLLRVYGHADFFVDRRSIECVPDDGCTPDDIEQLLLDQILPQLLHLRGQPAFHASAVELDAGVVVGFVGRSGRGKSTLAGSFGADRPIVSDDCLAVELDDGDAIVLPSYASVRLWEDSARTLFVGRSLAVASPRAPKLRVESARPVGRLRLRKIYALEPSEGEPTISNLSRRDAIVELANHLHRLDPLDPDLLRRELPFLERLVTTVPVARLGYRRSYEDLARVRATIEADAALSVTTE